MNSQFLVRIELPGWVKYEPIQGQKQAMDFAHAYAVMNRGGRVDVLDATGRIVWQAASRT